MPYLDLETRDLACAHYSCDVVFRGFGITKKKATGNAQAALTAHINETHDKDES